MRSLRILLLGTVLGAVCLAGCDCESMLATKRRPGAPTASAGPEWQPEPPAVPQVESVRAARPRPAWPESPPPEPEPPGDDTALAGNSD